MSFVGRILHLVGVFGSTFLFLSSMVMGSPETRFSDSESFFCNILIGVEIENGGRKAKVEWCCLG